MSKREEAILICSIAASNPDLSEAYGEIRRLLDLPMPPRWHADLAMRAWSACQNEEHPDAEAEALLRTHWSHL